MIGGLKTLMAGLGAALLQPQIERVKSHIVLMITTYVVIALFALLGMLCLFLLVFFSLASRYSPEIAAFLLLCFCVFMALGTLLVHEYAGRLHRKRYETTLFDRKLHLTTETPDTDELNRAIKRYARENKFTGLLITAVVGAILGARPGETFRTASRLVKRRRD